MLVHGWMDGWSLVVELTEQCRATLDPVLDRLVGLEQNRQHEVGRVSSGRQNAASLACLVHRALVSVLYATTHATAPCTPSTTASRELYDSAFNTTIKHLRFIALYSQEIPK